MIGSIDQLEGWANLTDLVEDDERRGRYYCGCSLTAGKDHCEHHGDPVWRYPREKPTDDT